MILLASYRLINALKENDISYVMQMNCPIFWLWQISQSSLLKKDKVYSSA